MQSQPGNVSELRRSPLISGQVLLTLKKVYRGLGIDLKSVFWSKIQALWRSFILVTTSAPARAPIQYNPNNYPIMENQMEKQMENEMETGFI